MLSRTLNRRRADAASRPGRASLALAANDCAPAQEKRRVLFVINSLAGGGAERVFSRLVQELDQPCHALAITAVLLDDVADEAYSLPADVLVVRLDARGSMVRSIIRLHRLVKRLKPHVTVSFLCRANVAAVLVMRLRGKAAIISERVNTAAHLGTGRTAWASRMLICLTYPRATRVIAVSDGVANTLEQDFSVSRQRLSIISNPVDIDAIRDCAAAPPEIAVSRQDIVTMGRLVANKNTAMAIQALAASQSGGRLIVLGEGPLKSELQALCQSLGLSQRVVFAGFIANPYAVLARAGCYLLTSHAEGFPNALVEAMACGLPVIAADCPSGPAEILQASLTGQDHAFGRGGALVRMDDHKAMAGCIDKLAIADFREFVAREALERAGNFSVQRAVQAFCESIVEAVPFRGAARP